MEPELKSNPPDPNLCALDHYSPPCATLRDNDDDEGDDSNEEQKSQ